MAVKIKNNSPPKQGEVMADKDIRSLFPTPEELAKGEMLVRVDEVKNEDDSNINTESQKEVAAEVINEADDLKKEYISEEKSENTTDIVEDKQFSGLSDVEKEAIRQGWVPKDQFKGDPKHWRDAKAWVDRGELLEKLNKSHEETKLLQQSLRHLLDLNKNAFEKAKKAEADSLLKAKRDAIVSGNVEAVETIEQEYAKLTKSADVEISQSEIPKEVYEFVDRNKSWFNDDTQHNKDLKSWATAYENNLLNKYKISDPILRLEEVEKAVKEHPIYKKMYGTSSSSAENTQRTRPSVVETSRTPIKTNASSPYALLPEEAKIVVRRFVDKLPKNTMTRDEYAQQLIDSGAVNV